MKGYRTVCFNLIAALPIVLDVALSVLSTPEVRHLVPKDWMPWYSLGIVIMNIVLRAITTTPIFNNRQSEE